MPIRRPSLFCASAVICWGVLHAAAAVADDDNGAFAIRGAGVIDCDTFLAEKEAQSTAYIMMGGWIDGYLTGYNQLADDTYDIMAYQSTELLVTIIENHCRNNAEHTLFAVVSSIANQLIEDRVRFGSPIVTVSVDGENFRLYRETIRRIQARLSGAGFLGQDPTGEFDEATLAAVRAYQDSIGYDATGRPDQATLWNLFAE